MEVSTLSTEIYCSWKPFSRTMETCHLFYYSKVRPYHPALHNVHSMDPFKFAFPISCPLYPYPLCLLLSYLLSSLPLVLFISCPLCLSSSLSLVLSASRSLYLLSSLPLVLFISCPLCLSSSLSLVLSASRPLFFISCPLYKCPLPVLSSLSLLRSMYDFTSCTGNILYTFSSSKNAKRAGQITEFCYKSIIHLHSTIHLSIQNYWK